MSRLDALRQEIEDTRAAYHRLLDELPDEALDLPSANPAWSVRGVLYHMSLAPRMLGADLRMFYGPAWVYRLIPRLVPAALFNRLNAFLTRRGAHGLDRRGLAAAYDRAHRQVLRALNTLKEEDLDRWLPYPDWDPLLSGPVSIERLFHYVKNHFDAHAKELDRIAR